MHSAGDVSPNPEIIPPGLPLPIDGRTLIHGIVGDPISQVGSPGLFNMAFRKQGLNAVLVPLHVHAPDLAETLRGLHCIQNLRGLVLTTPHKRAGVELVDSMGPEARLAGSINAIRIENNRSWHGGNFDGLGCVKGLHMAGHVVKSRRILIVGMGGAGRAVAAAIARENPAELRLYDIDDARTSQVCADLREAMPGIRLSPGEPDPHGFNIVINCTPLGMTVSPGLPVDPERVDAESVVVDLVVEPVMTALLRAAEAKGCQIQPGRRTLEGQIDAVCAFFAGDGDG